MLDTPVTPPEQKLERDVVSENSNTEGMLLAKQDKSLESLEKFRISIKANPSNLNPVFNAVQLILEHSSLNDDPKYKQEAQELLSSVKIDKSDIRWVRYQNLLAMVKENG